MAVSSDETGERFTSEIGGLIATAVVGIVLLGCSGGMGLLIGFLFPAHWLTPVAVDLSDEQASGVASARR